MRSRRPDRAWEGADRPHLDVGRDMPDDGDPVNPFPRMATEPELQYKVLVETSSRLYGF